MSQDFESFLLTFQRKEPMIHILYTAMGSFLSKLLTKFVPAKAFMDEAGTPEQRMKSIEYLASIDVCKEKNQRSLKSIDIGTNCKTKLFVLEGDVLEEIKLKFRQERLSFYVTAVTLLQKNLPSTAPVIRDAQFLHPEKRNDPASLTAVSKLTLVIADVLQSPVEDNMLLKVFHTQPTIKTEGICDLVRRVNGSSIKQSVYQRSSMWSMLGNLIKEKRKIPTGGALRKNLGWG